MAWLKTLAETYDVYADLAGKEENDQPMLLPVFHSTFNAQIEVTIDGQGNFKDARRLEKGKGVVTIIPVTGDSATRSSGNTPHPLCDKLCYIAGDYTIYTGDDKEEYYQKYMEQLKGWVQSEESHPMVQAIYYYLEKKSLIQDLVEKGVLELDENGKLTDQVKLHNQDQSKANVRFLVYGDDMFEESAVWKNQTLYQKYIQYCRKQSRNVDLCYATGELLPRTDKHPAKIRNSGDKAKLISANDSEGFTYRGRFAEKDQAYAVGYDVSQKAHNALRWLIQKQGYTRDDSAFVCWMVNRDMPLLDPMKDSVNAMGSIGELEFDDDWMEMEELDLSNARDTGKYVAEQLNRAILGYAGKIEVGDRVAMISLDAATKGRLSIVYYDEMGGKEYIDAIWNWQEHCKWRRTIRLEYVSDGKKKLTLACTPAPRDMALAAFGVQRSEWLEGDSKVIRATVKRLLPCITKRGVKIPRDIIKAAARRASMPESMSSFVWWNDVLCVTCAMIRYNYEEGDKTMGNFLSDNKDDRNVLFGRLLAIYDYMEQRAMYEREENGAYKDQRTTNAKRYWNAFSSRPAKTAQTIRQNLISYEKKLSDYERKKFDEWTGEIMVCLSEHGYDNVALSEMYLPGYYLQMEEMRNAFYMNREQKDKEE